MDENETLTPVDAANALLEGTTNDYVWRFIEFDVRDPDAYYFDAVYWAFLHEPQITTGKSDTLFAPDDAVTRGQAVTFLWRAAGQPKAQNANNPFEDVKESNFYYKAAIWAYENGLADEDTGVTETAFNGAETCTRGQTVTILYRTNEE